MPQEYTQATALTKTVQNACKVKSDEKFCNLYQYVDLSNNDDIIKLEAEKPGRSLQRYPAQLFNDTEVLSKLDYEAMVILSPINVSICCDTSQFQIRLETLRNCFDWNKTVTKSTLGSLEGLFLRPPTSS